jgi:hypothetical protein
LPRPAPSWGCWRTLRSCSSFARLCLSRAAARTHCTRSWTSTRSPPHANSSPRAALRSDPRKKRIPLSLLKFLIMLKFNHTYYYI